MLPSILSRRRTHCRLAIAAFALCLACASEAKEFTWEFKRNGGSATQTFDGIGPLFTYFVTPTAYQPELLGEVTLDTISILAPGSALSQGGFFDTEIYFYGPSNSGLAAGQKGNQVSFPAQPSSGGTWQFVTRSDSAGTQNFDANFDFETKTGSANSFLHLVKKAERGPFVTDPAPSMIPVGLGAQIRVWTAAAPTNITIDQFEVKVTGAIVRYQIAPFVNDGTIEIEKDDDAYNNRVVFNGGTIRIRDKLNNRGILDNGGSILIEEASHLTELTNRGSLNMLPASQIANSGRLVNEAGGLITGSATIDNMASFAGDPSPIDPNLPFSRDPGFFNRGTLDLAANGKVNNTVGAKFDNTGTFTVGLDATFSNEGNFTNGTAHATGGTLVNAGKVEHLGGSFLNYARMESRGRFINSGTLDNQGVLDVLEATGLGNSEFINSGTLRNGINDAVSLADPGRGTIRVEGSFQNDGVLDNRSILEVQGELLNNGHLWNGNSGNVNDDVHLRLRGHIANSSSAEFTNHGLVQVSGGYFENQGSVANHGRLVFTGDGVIGGAAGSFSGGVVTNTGTVQVDEGGAMLQLVRYRQTGANAVTIVNGLLQAQTVEIEEGILKGRDRVSTILLTVGANATVNPGTSPGTLTVLGSMVIDGVLELELSPTASDHLDVTGTLNFKQGATVRFSFLGGLLPEPGRRFSFADYVTTSGGVYGLGLVTFDLVGLPVGYVGEWDGSGFTLAAVPEPQTYAMLGMGLLVVATATRRRWRIGSIR